MRKQYIVTTKNGKKGGIAYTLATAKKMAKALKESTGEDCTIIVKE